MYYYLVASYDISNLELDGTTQLRGPFPSEAARADAIHMDMEERDLECSETCGVTLLEVKADKSLVRTGSYIVEWDDEDDDEDDDDDED